jgi:DNA primase
VPLANKPLTFALKGIDPSHPYLKQRGVSEETARVFGAGHFSGNGSMKDRIVFPITNRGGELVAYAGRATEPSVEPRWKFPSGFHKSLELFGIQEARNSRSVVLVESFWGVLKLREAGVIAIALMGRSLSKDQQALLEWLNPVSIVILMDGDEPGRAGGREIAGRLVPSFFVRIAELPSEKQPDHLSTEEIRKMLADCGDMPGK